MTHQLWGGRFASGPSELLRAFNDSFSFDRALLAEDIEGSIAWAKALAQAGAISGDECATLVDGLQKVLALGDPEGDYEDVHSYAESKLQEIVGTVAGKLHTGRSRNDQVATDLRLWLKKAVKEAASHVRELAMTLAQTASAETTTPMPGYTHLKRAEPVTFGHWCMAYVAMLERDLDRLNSALSRGDECPLGSAALSGTPLAIDRDALAKSLGFPRATPNSLDAVSDRDLAADYLFAATLLFTHMSRLAEDLIFFTSDEVAYAELPDALATGSSRMPQKKNPDVLELVRGHAGRILGELTGFLALLKGLPLAYDKDLQLDKEPLFRVRSVIAVALPALSSLIAGLTLNRHTMRNAASHDLLLATAVADAMASRGVPFRQAHDIVSARIAEALKVGRTLRQLGATEHITVKDLEALDVDRALAVRNVKGGTAPARVKEAAAAAIKRLS